MLEPVQKRSWKITWELCTMGFNLDAGKLNFNHISMPYLYNIYNIFFFQVWMRLARMGSKELGKVFFFISPLPLSLFFKLYLSHLCKPNQIITFKSEDIFRCFTKCFSLPTKDRLLLSGMSADARETRSQMHPTPSQMGLLTSWRWRSSTQSWKIVSLLLKKKILARDVIKLFYSSLSRPK